MADDRIQRPNLPSPPDQYDRENEAAFRREMETLYAEVDAALARFADTISDGLVPHATSHEIGGDDVIDVTEAMISDLDHFTEADGNAFWSQLGHTHLEADVTDLGDYITEAEADVLYEPVLGNPASDGYHLISTAAGVRSWAAVSAGVTDHGALTGLGDDDHSIYALVAGTRAFTGQVTCQTSLVVGTSTTTDLKIHEAAAGDWMVEAQSTNDLHLKGAAVLIDDGGTNTARAAAMKSITSTATAPTGDYPYGTLHLIY